MNPPGISVLDQAAAPSPIRPWQQRISLVDYAKGIGIFLVVLGHVLRGLVGTVVEASAITQILDQWIYAFHNQPIIHIVVGVAVGLAASLLFYQLCMRFRIFYLFRLQPVSASSR